MTTNNIALFNCSLSMWAHYRQTVMESGRQPYLAMTPDGSVVINARGVPDRPAWEFIARFSSLDEAKSVLLGAGWVIDGDRVLVQKEWIKHAPIGGAA